MKTLTFVPSVLLALCVTGCITNKDVGIESETSSSSDGTAESGSATNVSGTATASESESAGETGIVSGTATASESESESESASDTGVISGTATASATDATSETGDASSSSTGGEQSVEQQLCESQGGLWDLSSCGHYACGSPPDCAAVIPGCDCGPFATFTKAGCTPQAECSVDFACGPDDTCTAGGAFCSVFVPGVKGADTSYACEATPDACLGDYSCGCLEDAGVFGLEGNCMAGDDGEVTVTVYGA